MLIALARVQNGSCYGQREGIPAIPEAEPMPHLVRLRGGSLSALEVVRRSVPSLPVSRHRAQHGVGDRPVAHIAVGGHDVVRP
jgi:hypothetical protein